MDGGDVEQRTAAAERKVALLTEKTAQLHTLIGTMAGHPHSHSPSPSTRVHTPPPSADLLPPPSAVLAAARGESSLPPVTAAFLLTELQALREALALDEAQRHKLQEENRKLKYRVQILLRSLAEEEAKHSPAKPQPPAATAQH